MEPSYASGTSSTPLLGDTIGDNLDRTIERFADREALVSVHQDLRYTYAQFGEAVDRTARAFIAAGIEAGDRVGIWSPNCAEWALVQYATAKAGIILVNINPAYRTSELEYVLRQSGCRMLVAATAFKTSDYVQMVDDVRDNLDGLEKVVFIGRDWERFIAGGERVSVDELAERQARDPVRRPDQHPVHERHHGLPQGRHAQPPQHPQQRLLRRPGLPLHRSGPSLHPGPVLPLLRDGHGQPRLHQPRRVHGHPGARLRPRGDAAGRPGRELHEPLRRPDDVHRRARAPRVRRVRPLQPADRDHGRLAVPDRDDAPRRLGDAHGGGHDLLRDDRDLAGVDADRRRRPAREARRHRRPRAPARRGQDRRPRERRDRGARAARRAVHARLQRDARLLGGTGEDRRRDRPRALDAHRRPRPDGRGRLREDRRPDQGHGHPRRRERLPARDRGVPDGAPRDPGRPGRRRPRSRASARSCWR